MKPAKANYQVGLILKTHGLKGEVKVKSTTDFPERFKKGAELLVKFDDQVQLLEISQSRQQKGFWFLTFKGLTEINLVTPLIGQKLYVSERNDQLGVDEFYVSDLIDLPVYDQLGTCCGHLKDILTYGPNDVWVIADTQGKEMLLPYTADFIKEVDLKQHKIIVDLDLIADEN